MSRKFWYLVSYSLKKKMKTKWFLIANLIIMISIIGIINIDSIINLFGGDFNDKTTVVILDKTGYTSDVFKKDLNETNKILANDYKTDFLSFDGDEESLKEEVKDNDKVGIIFDSDDDNYLKAKIITNSKIDSLYYQMLVQALTSTKTKIAMSLTNIDLEELNKISSPINIDRIILDNEAKTGDESMSIIMGTVFPTVILPFFMLIIFLVQMLGSEINEEKSTRSMEVIISNVSPKTHFFSKILAANTFVILQGILLLTYSGIGLLIRNMLNPVATDLTDNIGEIFNTLSTSGLVDKFYYLIPLTLVLMLLSFIAYSLVAGVLASMTVNMDDYQQIQTPIMLVSLLAYYLAIMAGVFNGSLLIRILSYFPFISCLLSPALLVLGQITVFDVLISIVVLIIFNFVAVKYGLKIYKVGILNYSTDKIWSRLFKAAKSK
mgnify:FL=1